MKRFFALWLLLGVVGFAVAGALRFALTRNLDLRFDAFLATLLAPALNAILLLWLLPPLRDERFGSLSEAFRIPRVIQGARVLIVGLPVLSALILLGIVPRWGFDLVRGILAIAAAFVFARAWRRHRISGAGIAASLLFPLGVTSGQLLPLAAHVFPTQPLGFRWIVFFGAATLIVLVMTFRAVNQLRISAPAAATLLETALAPAVAVALVVIGGMFWRPWLTPPWWLLANILGFLAIGFAFLASLACLTTTE
jgi:hypothetical protein